jgi:hypothetical protein
MMFFIFLFLFIVSQMSGFLVVPQLGFMNVLRATVLPLVFLFVANRWRAFVATCAQLGDTFSHANLQKHVVHVQRQRSAALAAALARKPDSFRVHEREAIGRVSVFQFYCAIVRRILYRAGTADALRKIIGDDLFKEMENILGDDSDAQREFDQQLAASLGACNERDLEMAGIVKDLMFQQVRFRFLLFRSLTHVSRL